ncbi:MAG: SDR family NAD(P)-dependent oxidoreductase, partial [Desulfobacula sp.]|nr:SDR family NAD(P)-dependent oxidoreductase [Desulfobacula sp.]
NPAMADNSNTKAPTEVAVKAAHTNETSQAVATVLIETISELTGFPVEMLEPSMNLESDLGIDSIKRVEILSKLEQALDHIDSISSDDIASLKTIEEIINYLTDSDSDTPQGSKKKLQTTDAEKKDEKPNNPAAKPIAQPAKELTRQIISLEEYPTNQIRFYNGARIDLPAQKKVYITKDSSGVSEQFLSEFLTLGIDAQLIDISKENIPNLPDVAGLVLVPDAFAPADAFKKNDKPSALRFLKSAFELIKTNAQYLMDSADQKGAFLTAISFMGGTFGFSDSSFDANPVFGGLSGLIKTAAIEFKNVLCRSLDMPDDLEKCKENTEAAVALMMTHGAVEMGLDGDSCNIPVLDNKDLNPSPLSIESDDVVIITGGAKGVTAACAIELARQYSPVLVLIGRSDLPSGEAEWSKGIDAPSKLKKAILAHAFGEKKPKPADIEKIYKQIISNRQIHKNMAQMEKYGSQVQYFCADIRNKDQIVTILDTVRQLYGKISGVIHGAGVLEDKLIVDKRLEQFTRVLETKVLGLDAILSGTKDDSLKHLVLFSSIAARTGNQGQSDYAMANEVLNKIAKRYCMDHPECNVVSINWGPWEGGMVDESLRKEFEKRGIDLIPLEAGAKQLLIEMGNKNINSPEVVIGAHLSKPHKPKIVKLSKIMTVPVSRSEVPVLASHKIAGEPVLPFALLMEYHAHVAEKNNPGLVLAGMDNIRLLKGVRPGNDLIELDVNMGKCRPGVNGFEAASTLASTSEGESSFIHSSGTMVLKEKRSKPPVLSSAAFMALTPYKRTIGKAYADILFHGKALQGIETVNGWSQKGIEVVTTLAPEPGQWLKKPLSSKWAIDPMMLDAAFQAAILWTFEQRGQVCLPSFIANLRLYSSFDTLKGKIRILFTVNEETRNKVKGYFTFLNENNTVVASITGFEAVTDPSLNEKFKNKPLFARKSILSFAQGNPSDAFGEKYKIFDKERQIARLPRPPYFFMDRVTKSDHPQWEMVPGGFIEAQYEIPANEWYFRANHTTTMPFCILLEIALQPCGWLAAYAGSALQSDDRLHFRNLGGKATLFEPITQNTGTLTMRCRMKEVSKAGGMIIQDFDMEVLDQEQIVYQGTTNFGFFSQQALSNQIGIRNSKFVTYSLPKGHIEKISPYTLPYTAPWTPSDPQTGQKNGMPAKALQMIDRIEVLSLDGGLYEKGYIKAIKIVDSQEWFFDAHFYQDPVCPGSLGVESFLQLVRFFLLKKFDIDPDIYQASILPGNTHQWSYRGQIIPKNKTIEVHAHIKGVTHEDDIYAATADGALVVDGICIYEMQDFTLGFGKVDATQTIYQKKVPEQKM